MTSALKPVHDFPPAPSSAPKLMNLLGSLKPTVIFVSAVNLKLYAIGMLSCRVCDEPVFSPAAIATGPVEALTEDAAVDVTVKV